MIGFDNFVMQAYSSNLAAVPAVLQAAIARPFDYTTKMAAFGLPQP